MDTDILIRKPTDLNKRWAHKILSQYSTAARVDAVDVRSVTIGTSTRFRVSVKHNLPELAPADWFVKAPSLFLKSRLITALPRLLHKEVRYYQTLSGNAPLNMPRVLAAQSRFGKGSTLVMADLVEAGYRPGQPADALTVPQAGQVVGQLAKFHGHFRNKPGLLKTHPWLGGFSTAAENHLGTLLAVPLMKRGLRLAGTFVAGKLHAPALRYAANRRKIMRALAAGRQTLVHHDCHPGNFFWRGSEPGFLDWQLVRLGEGVGDVAYFLATSLEPEVRRQHEQPLLQLYLDALGEQGVAELSMQSLYQRYRAHLTYAFEAMVVTLAIGDMMDLSGNLELIRRTAIAADDHDSYAALAI